MMIKKTSCLILTALFVTLTGKLYAQPKKITLTIDASKTYQTMENFAASDAWACQFVGKWPDEKRNRVADLLFSRDTAANGSPKGIALSMWRFNIGAGSTEQGAASGIRDEWHRTESFIGADGKFNPEKQAGEVWFLKAAKARGVKQFLGFTNSPPVQFTVNGRANADKGRTNIAPEKYADFASFLSKTVKGVEKLAGIKFNYISPVNEPQWEWSDAKQEGSPYHNAEISGLVRAIGKDFKTNKVGAKILVSEAGMINYLYKGDTKAKGSQAADFFRPGSANYIGDVPGIAKIIAGHSYFTTSPLASAIKSREALADTVASIPGLKFWQSEYCILGGNEGEINGSKRDLGIDAALYLARVIHTDITAANATAWQWWLAVSPFDYKDGLVYIDQNTTDGQIYSSKMLWALGNYSRFVEPGAIRISANTDDPDKQLMVSAYKQRKKLTVVLINAGADAVTVDLNAVAGNVKLQKSYITSQKDELKPLNISNNMVLVAGRSVTTLTGEIK